MYEQGFSHVRIMSTWQFASKGTRWHVRLYYVLLTEAIPLHTKSFIKWVREGCDHDNFSFVILYYCVNLSIFCFEHPAKNPVYFFDNTTSQLDLSLDLRLGPTQHKNY